MVRSQGVFTDAIPSPAREASCVAKTAPRALRTAPVQLYKYTAFSLFCTARRRDKATTRRRVNRSRALRHLPGSSFLSNPVWDLVFDSLSAESFDRLLTVCRLFGS